LRLLNIVPFLIDPERRRPRFGFNLGIQTLFTWPMVRKRNTVMTPLETALVPSGYLLIVPVNGGAPGQLQ